ncbi:MAG TPA: metallophosphoesterase, partial [Terriglobales bacterium]|nr:metallophosphoesterase [Terriglobales bacterium]
MEPRLVWPAPGLPELLGCGKAEISLLVDHYLDLESLRHWAAGLVLVDHHGERIALAVERIDPAPDPAELGHPSAAAALSTCGGGPALVRLRPSQPIAPLAGRTTRLFSVCRAETIVRRNCIAVVVPGRRLRLAFASDIHIAELWDRVFAAIERHAPDLLDKAVHPSRLLSQLVAEVNALAATGEIDLVVFGGDLVDHVYVQPRAEVARGRRETNLEIFLDLIAPLQVPAFTIAGNHDYRLYPWRPRAYGLGSIGLD